MAALRSLTDDSDLEHDLAETLRVLRRLRDAKASNHQQRTTLGLQIQACEKHLRIQRANLEAAS
jgi:hypothetical protein